MPHEPASGTWTVQQRGDYEHGRGQVVNRALLTWPNQALHLTAYSIRCAPASGSR